MNSKAGDAATKQVEELFSGAVYSARRRFRFMDNIREAQSVIKEFSLDESLLTKGLQKIYDALMKSGRYSEAARLATEFEL